MGIWGTGIFQNDNGCDVKNIYVQLLKDGKTTQEANSLILEQFKELIAYGEYDSIEFWLSLASIQWDYGRLDPDVKIKALQSIDGDDHLQPWIENGLKSDLNNRIKIINKFIEKINSPQPKEKIVKIDKEFICPWNIGDIFAYLLQSDKSKELNCFNKYIVFQKTNTRESYPKNTIPVLRVAKKIYDHIPTINEYLEENKQPAYWTPETYGKNSNKKTIFELEKVLYDYAVDANSLRTYPKNIIFLGNSLPIKKEYKEISESSWLISWKYFESAILSDYLYWKDINIKDIL